MSHTIHVKRAVRILGAWALLAAILACGSMGDTPDRSLRPPGDGWHCVAHASPARCVRTREACMVHVQQAVEVARQRGGAVVPICEQHQTADCLTHRRGGTPTFECYAVGTDDCHREHTQIEGSSICAIWH